MTTRRRSNSPRPQPQSQPLQLSTDTRISRIWQRCISFQKQVFGSAWPRNADDLTQQYSMLIVKEVMEVLDHTSYKPHKPRINFDECAEARKEEIADVLIYSLDLAASQFVSLEELLETIERKININNTRLANVSRGPWQDVTTG